MKNKQVSILVPVFNEEKSVSATIKAIKESLSGKVDYEIIAVNDGSSDRTKEVLASIKGITVINKPYNMGYSSALKTGLKQSKYDLIAITDADGTYPIKDLPRLLKHADIYDMVVGSRTGSKVQDSFLRGIAKGIIKSLARFLTGMKIPDINSGFRVFKKEQAMEFYHLYPSRFSFTITITLSYLIHDYSVKFLPINYAKRKGKSTIHPVKDFLGFSMIIIRIATLFNPIKVFTTLSAIVALFGVLVLVYTSLIVGKVMDATVTILFVSALQIFLFGLLAYLVTKQR